MKKKENKLNKINKEKLIWKPIKYGINNYFISNTGLIKNIKTGKIRKNTKDKYGYEYCLIGNKEHRKMIRIHRQLAICFIPNDNPNYTVIDHIDRNPLNNSLDNLRWTDWSGNAINRDNTLIGYNFHK